MNIATTDLPSVTVAYIRQTGPYGPELKQLWQKIGDWAKAHGLGDEPGFSYGISLDSPMDTPPEKCRYDACITLSKEIPLDGEVKKQTLPGGRYIVVPFHGSGPEIGPGFVRVFDEVLPQNGLDFDFTRPVFERYAAGCDIAVDGTFACDLCVPVK